jgi:hypothetical protein
VSGSEGTMVVSATGNSNIRHALLDGSSTQDAEVEVKVKTDKLASGGLEYVYLVTRSQGSGHEYRGRMQLSTSGTVGIQAGTFDAVTDTDTLLGDLEVVGDLTHQAAEYINFKMQVSGISPTTIKLKAWGESDVEPDTWDYEVTDSTAELQTAGEVGLAARVATAANNTPVTFTFDNFQARTTLLNSSPTPAPTVLPSPSPAASSSPSVCADNATSSLVTYTNVQPIAYDYGQVTLQWETASAESSRVEYGTTDSYGSVSVTCTLATTHQVTLRDLTPGTTYHFRVGRGNGSSMSSDFTFVVPYEIGLLTSSAGTEHSEELYENGVRSKTFSVNWSSFEPTQGNFDEEYIAEKAEELANYQAQGFEVVLSPGLQYPPDWVFSLDANAYFKNQYGESYDPNISGKDVANIVFNNTVRTAGAAYLDQLFTEFGTDFSAIRAGGGWFGELHYPPATNETTGSVNSFWGYDANAQGTSNNRPTGIAANPVPGWIPNPVRNGTFEKTSLSAFSTDPAYDTIVSTGAHRGSYALRKIAPGTANANESLQTSIPVVSGREYAFSGWAKTSVASERACIQIRRSSNDAQIALLCTDSATFAELTTTFTAPESSIEIALLSADTADTAILMWDDIAILAEGYTYDADHSDARAFWEWYRDALINYQNWQIEQIRDSGFSNYIYVLYPSYGIRTLANTNQVEEAIEHDLARSSTAGVGGDMSQATDWGEQIASYPDDDKLVPYTTWIDSTGSDVSSNKGSWTAPKYLAYLADYYDHRVHGENTGDAALSDLQSAFSLMVSNNFDGLFWFNEPQLYGGTYATLAQFNAEILDYDDTTPYNLSLVFDGGATTTSDATVALQLGVDDNVNADRDLVIMVSESSDFSGASYVAYPTNGAMEHTFSSSTAGTKTLYYRVRDEVGNVSPIYTKSITLGSSGGGESGSGSGSSGGSSGSGGSTCSTPGTLKAPDLFEIRTVNTSAELYITPLLDATEYVVSYGYQAGTHQFGTVFAATNNAGVTKLTINNLTPNTVYYFMVRAQFGCQSGEWSPSLKVKTTNSAAKQSIFYAYGPQKDTSNYLSVARQKKMGRSTIQTVTQSELETTNTSSPDTKPSPAPQKQTEPDKEVPKIQSWWERLKSWF